MKTRSQVKAEQGEPTKDNPFPRTPDGTINNCALAHGEPAKGCQMCKGACPDKAKFPTSTRVDAEPPTPPPAENEPPPRTGYDFPNANARKGKPLTDGLARIVEEVFIRDLHGEWKQLEEALQLGEKRSEHGHAVAALDKAATLAYRAHRLYLTARASREEWEAENEVIFGAMLSQATHDLQREKDSGTRSKQITDADVKARVATLFPDEWRAQETRRRNVELTVKSLERLAELWMGRTRDLQALVGKLRG